MGQINLVIKGGLKKDKTPGGKLTFVLLLLFVPLAQRKLETISSPCGTPAAPTPSCKNQEDAPSFQSGRSDAVKREVKGNICAYLCVDG